MSVLTNEMQTQEVGTSRIVACGVPLMEQKTVAEIQSIAERLHLLAAKDTSNYAAEVQVLSHELNTWLAAQQAAAAAQATRSLNDIERDHILAVLSANDWSRSRTAKVLGIDVKTLYNKIKKYEAGGFIPRDI